MGNDYLERKQQLDQDLESIDELLKKGLANEAYRHYSALIKKIENSEYDFDISLKAKTYASFAYFLFSVSEYARFFEMIIKAQELGHSKDEIKNVLWQAFIEPNLEEFKAIYEANISVLNSYASIKIEKPVAFEELPLWLIPTGIQNEYYMYDKEQKRIKEKIELNMNRNVPSLPESDAFSDYLLIASWDWRSILTYSNAIRRKNKKSYVVLEDLGTLLSCLQGVSFSKDMLSNVLIFEHFESMRSYFMQSNSFLPRNIINLSDPSLNLRTTLKEIHDYRLNRENRKGDRILLSIGMPTYNRGNRAYDNVIHLLKSYYDEEIEIIVSNNGTQNETKEDYDKIRNIDDARLKYFAFEENQGYAINCCKVCELAEGEFILLVSDEDLVDHNVLDKIMNILRNSTETLALLKASTSVQSKQPTKSADSGEDALLTFMLTSNYVSGMIFNNTLLKQYRGIEYVKENIDRSVCFWYPHMFWELLLCQYGEVQSTELILLNEGLAEKTECDEVELANGEIIIPYYATIEGRLEQHESFTAIFNDLERCKESFDLFREMYSKLCRKTMFLVTMAINAFYRKTDVDTFELLDRAYTYCTRKEFFLIHSKGNLDNYDKDVNDINKFYDFYKLQIRDRDM